MQLKAKKTLQLCTLAALLLLSVGCSKLTSENYDQLEVGMTYGEVVALLGDADDCSSTMTLKSCTWGSETKHISIQFAGDKVAFYSSKGL